MLQFSSVRRISIFFCLRMVEISIFKLILIFIKLFSNAMYHLSEPLLYNLFEIELSNRLIDLTPLIILGAFPLQILVKIIPWKDLQKINPKLSKWRRNKFFKPMEGHCLWNFLHPQASVYLYVALGTPMASLFCLSY